MMYLAISIGFLGSIHCIGMCGPLAMGVSSFYPQSRWIQFSKMLSYNMGRIGTYAFLGLLLGIIGKALIMTEVQKFVSILSGVFLIVLFLLSLDTEQFLSKFQGYKNYLKRYNQWFAQMMNQFKTVPPFILGAINGLLPCGLVYLAMLGAMTSGGIEQGVLFMSLFGLGTLPAMMITVLFGRELLNLSNLRLRRLIPWLQMCLGIYLIYRGIVVDMPQELDFYSLLARPVMCH
jgi:uncharacterized protein